jgi:hypothetical protein
MIPTRPPPSPASETLSRSLRKQRAKLGLETAQPSSTFTPISPSSSIIDDKGNNITSFSLPVSTTTTSQFHSSSSDQLPRLLLSPPATNIPRKRTPALLSVPTINDHLGLNLLKLREQQQQQQQQQLQQQLLLQQQPKHNNNNNLDANLDASWSIHSYNSSIGTSRIENDGIHDEEEERSLSFLSFNLTSSDTLKIKQQQQQQPTIEPYFAKNGDIEHVRKISSMILNNIRQELEKYQYQPNRDYDATPPSSVTRLCFESLLRLTKSMTGPISKLMLQAYDILKKNAYVDEEFTRELLIPLGVVDSSSPSLLHSEVVEILNNLNKKAHVQYENILKKKKESDDELNHMNAEMNELLKKEHLLKQELTQLLRTEGSAEEERSHLKKQEKKLNSDLKHAR